MRATRGGGLLRFMRDVDSLQRVYPGVEFTEEEYATFVGFRSCFVTIVVHFL